MIELNKRYEDGHFSSPGNYSQFIENREALFSAQAAREDSARNTVRREIGKATQRTSTNTGMVLSVALNYGGRAEIVDACRTAMRRMLAESRSPDELTEEAISENLYTHDLPELDLLVRTSGEMRISNFLLWQAAYSEIYVSETLWPDFRRVHLLEAVADFQRRDRRFGGLKLVAQVN